MAAQKETWIGLVRAIGGATHRKMSMAQLRSACADVGFEDVRTVLATGNVIFSSDRAVSEIGKALDGVIAGHDLNNEVFMRRHEELRAVLAEDPFPEASAERPGRMLVLFMKRAASVEETAAIGRYDGPERITLIGREAYIDYCAGVAVSKLTPMRLEKLLGQSGTARNWNTVQKLVDAAAR